MIYTTTTKLAVAVLSNTLADQSIGFNQPAYSEDPEQQRIVVAPEESSIVQNEVLGGSVSSSPSTQDAINTAQKILVAEDAETMFFTTEHGLGVIAIGYAYYDTSNENQTLNQLNQRAAFINASLEARVHIAEFLNGLTVRGKQEMVRQFELVDTDSASLANVTEISTESIQERVSAMLRGAVIYDMQDNPEDGQVMVSVVSTPKTQGSFQAVSSSVTLTSNLNEAIDEVFNEVKAGLVPPDGGRLIVAPSTGGVVWVGFGSAVGRTNRNPQLQRRLNSETGKTAKMRARRSLLAVINGEFVSKESKLNQQLENEISQFEKVIGDDGNNVITPLDSDTTNAISTQLRTDIFSSSVVGKLPAGVSVRSFTTKGGGWSYAAAIFVPEVTLKAKEIQRLMRKSSPLNQINWKRGYKIKDDGLILLDDNGLPILQSMGSGRVTEDKDL